MNYFVNREAETSINLCDNVSAFRKLNSKRNVTQTLSSGRIMRLQDASTVHPDRIFSGTKAKTNSNGTR